MAKGIRTIWIDSDTVGVTGTKVYKDGLAVDTIAQGIQEFKDPDVVEGVEYEYVLQAVTADGESVGEVLGVNKGVYTIENSIVLKPIMTNFRIEDDNKDRVYFDTPLGPISGTDFADYTITNKTISGLDTNANYFTVSSPFTFWDNNTIKQVDGNEVVYDFSLEPIKNYVAEPENYTKTMFVADNGSDSNGGLSEGDAYLTYSKALQNTVSGGNKIWIKAGTYSDSGLASSTASDGTITNPTTTSGYKVTPGDLDGQESYYSYGDGNFDPTEMPLFDGGNRATVNFMTVITSRFRIYKNIQFTDYAKVFYYSGNESRDGMIWDNCLFRNIGDAAEGGSGSSNGQGIVFQNSALTSNYVRIINSFFENITATTVKTAGQHCAIINTQGYCNESSTNNTYAATDYYLQHSGSYGVIRNCFVYRNIDPSQKGHYGHGVVFKTEQDGNCQHNLSVDNEVVNVLGAYELRNMNSRYNVVKRCISRADVPDRYESEQGTAGFKVLDGSRDNIIEQNTFHDLDIGWAIWRWDESGDEGSAILARNNTIKNNLFYNLKQFIAVNITRGSVKSLPTDNKIYNNTIDNCLYMWDIYQGTSEVEFDSSNLFTNNAFSNITNEFRQNAPTGWTYDYNNWHLSYTNDLGSNATNDDPDYTGNYIPQTTMNAPKIVGVNYDGDANERADTTTRGKQEINGVTPTPPLTFEILSYEISEETTTTARVRATMTKNCSINYYVDTVKNAASSDDFDAYEAGPNEWRHNRVLTGLTPGTTANLIIEVTAQDDLEVVQSGDIPLTTPSDVTPTVTVSNTVAADFTTIQAAVDSGLVAGDIVGLYGGDEFFESVTINAINGANGNPITFTSYGTGQAVIKGSKDTGAFTGGTSVWSTQLGADTAYQVFQNGEVMANARIPEVIEDYGYTDNYFKINSVTNQTTFTSSSMAGIVNLDGAKIHIVGYPWVLSTRTIVSHNEVSGEVVIDSSPSGTIYANSQFFVNEHSSLLTTANNNRWYGMNATLSVRSDGVQPTNISYTAIDDNGINLEDSDNITITNIQIKDFNQSGIKANRCVNLVIDEIEAYNNYYCGVFVLSDTYTETYTHTITNCDIKGGDYSIKSSTPGATITNNTTSDNGMLKNINPLGYEKLIAIQAYSTNAIITGNAITNCGYCGINFAGQNMLIENNYVIGHCLTTYDGAGIYAVNSSYTDAGSQNSTVNQNTVITQGDIGTWNLFGIYMDDFIHDVTITDNNLSGGYSNIYLHNNKDNIVTGNKLYQSTVQNLLFQEDAYGGIGVVGNNIDGNQYFQSSALPTMNVTTSYTTYDNFGSYDNNLYYGSQTTTPIQTRTDTGTVDKTLTTWQGEGFDTGSTTNITVGVNESFFAYNPTGAAYDITLPTGKWDSIDGTVTDQTGTINIAAYSSEILIKQ